ncbi:MAG: thiolase family protein [Desulfurococcales archaeon]|nr:thiolase family protein [Desulfurococcales archaeon]
MVYVSKVGMVKIGRHYEKSPRDLAFEAVREALADADIDSIDYLVVASGLTYMQSPQLDLAAYIGSSLGLPVKSALAVEAGENSGLAAIEVAVNLIRSHAAEKVLVIGVDKLTDYPSGPTYEMLEALYDTESDAIYRIGHAAPLAMLMRIYMEKYGIDRNTLAYWPAMMHAHAKENPYAMLRFAIKPEKVTTAMPIADPITLLDAYPLGDGAAAILLTSEDQVGDHLARIKEVAGAVGMPSIALRDDPLMLEHVAKLSNELNLSEEKVDVIELHDNFTIMGLLLLESLGLAPRGKAAELVAAGYFDVDGEGPLVNASGGLKARGHPIGATGVYMVAEVALQLAGKFPGVKRPGAEKGLAVGVNAHGSSTRIVVMESV